MKSSTFNYNIDPNPSLVSFKSFEETGLVKHGMSTRKGGYSEGVYNSMNLSFTRGDNPDHVKLNFKKMADILKVAEDSFVFSHQVHDNKILHVSERDKGKGYNRSSDIKGVDGLITDSRGITLTTFYADCVPLFFLDPVKKAIGLSHAGWRGSVLGIGPRTVMAMARTFGSKPEDILVGIGPSIGPCCYEVSQDVINEFENKLNRDIIGKIAKMSVKAHHEDKFMFDLWTANQQMLLETGVMANHISTTDLCTMCHHEMFFSHRVMGNARGSLAAFLALNAD